MLLYRLWSVGSLEGVRVSFSGSGSIIFNEIVSGRRRWPAGRVLVFASGHAPIEILYIMYRLIFAVRKRMHMRGYCRHAVSVRPSVRPSRS